VSAKEGERAARCLHVARRLPGDIAIIGPARRAAHGAIGRNGDAAAEIGDGVAARDIGTEIMVKRGTEQQAVSMWLGLIGRCHGRGGIARQRQCQKRCGDQRPHPNVLSQPRRAGDHFMFLCLSIGLETGVINQRCVMESGKIGLARMADGRPRRGHRDDIYQKCTKENDKSAR
jgi:hypothetical protein